MKLRTLSLTVPLLVITLILQPDISRGQEPDAGSDTVNAGAETTLVRVNITTESVGAGETVIINGRRVRDYRPKIIQLFPSTGVVIDEKGHVLAFLGYRWVNIQGRERKIEIVTARGGKLPGKLVGIDQSTGVAVVRCERCNLEKTPMCLSCEVRDGATVVTPILEEHGASQLQSAKVLSVGTSAKWPQGGWEVIVNRRLPVIGEPLLDARHRVLGYIASQKPSVNDPADIQAVIYPMTQLLNSADKIIKAGGDIHTGWLGVYLDESASSRRKGLKVRSVLMDSPAQAAGLEAEDLLMKWNGAPIQDALQFIRYVQNTSAGTKVDLEVSRRGRPVTVSAVIGHRKPEEDRGAIIVRFPEEISLPGSGVQGEITYLRSLPEEDLPRLGLDVIAVTSKLAEYLQMSVRSGLLVANVEDGMPGALGGVHVGDVILSVDDRGVLDPRDLSAHIHSRGWGSTIVLKVLRNGSEKELIVDLTPPDATDAERRPRP